MSEIAEIVPRSGHKDTVYNFSCIECGKSIYRKHLMDRTCDECYKVDGDELKYQNGEGRSCDMNLGEQSEMASELSKEIDKAVSDCYNPPHVKRAGDAQTLKRVMVNVFVNGKSFPVPIELYNIVMLILSSVKTADDATDKINSYIKSLNDVLHFMKNL